MSAILLNDDYYQMLNSGKVLISDIVLLSEVYLIPFKAKAWLDLTRRKIEGKPMDEKDIKKHKNDIVSIMKTGSIFTFGEQLNLDTRTYILYTVDRWYHFDFQC